MVATVDGYVLSKPQEPIAVIEIKDTRCSSMEEYFQKTVIDRSLGVVLRRNSASEEFKEKLRP